MLDRGKPLALRLPGRFGLELRAIVAGGERIGERLRATGGDVFQHRPTLSRFDWIVVAWRALFPVDASLDDKDVTSPERGEKLLQGAVPRSQPYEVTHSTAYRVHERVASTYVKGRMVIAGDAAHVNNPLGGMGLNGGIHDAFNLSGKLIDVIRGAPLDTLPPAA